MTKTKASKAVKKLVKKILNIERERVLYSYDAKSKAVTVTFKNKKLLITAEQVKDLTARLNDLKRFYSYCNADVKLLRRLECDAQAKKQQLVKNTQYDSRKKLFRLLQQITLSSMKQKSKAKQKVKVKK